MPGTLRCAELSFVKLNQAMLIKRAEFTAVRCLCMDWGCDDHSRVESCSSHAISKFSPLKCSHNFIQLRSDSCRRKSMDSILKEEKLLVLTCFHLPLPGQLSFNGSARSLPGHNCHINFFYLIEWGAKGKLFAVSLFSLWPLMTSSIMLFMAKWALPRRQDKRPAHGKGL